MTSNLPVLVGTVQLVVRRAPASRRDPAGIVAGDFREVVQLDYRRLLSRICGENPKYFQGLGTRTKTTASGEEGATTTITNNNRSSCPPTKYIVGEMLGEDNRNHAEIIRATLRGPSIRGELCIDFSNPMRASVQPTMSGTMGTQGEGEGEQDQGGLGLIGTPM